MGLILYILTYNVCVNKVIQHWFRISFTASHTFLQTSVQDTSLSHANARNFFEQCLITTCVGLKVLQSVGCNIHHRMLSVKLKQVIMTLFIKEVILIPYEGKWTIGLFYHYMYTCKLNPANNYWKTHPWTSYHV